MPVPLVLIIEDSVPDAELARAAILSLDSPIEVITAASASAGLAQLARFPGDPDHSPVLVWLDMNLPEVTGLEIIKRIRSSPETATIPIVAFSGSEQMQTVRSALEAGANIYVHKPDDVDLYMRRVGRVTEAFLEHALSPSLNS